MTMYFFKIYYHFRCTTLYIYIQKYFINYFLNLILLNFLWKTGPRGEMNAPGNLLKLNIYMKFRNKNMDIWWTILKNIFGLYAKIKLIFETLILKLEYHVEQIGWPWKKNLYENHRKIFNIFKKYFWFSYFLYYQHLLR